ncbi:MAG TPA: ABC transporter substrate-binding protein [Streptosporangiaceae bacterium]|jgi:putative spermidine/putrescine transport system substrate-binding protein
MTYVRFARLAPIAAVTAILAIGAAACGGSNATQGPGGDAPKLPVQQSIGKGEGQLNLVAWAGYVEHGQDNKNDDWVTPFQKQTGCKVNVKVADTSDSMVSLMKTGQYDGVSASGDASLRLVYGGTVAPVNTGLVPNYADVESYLKEQPYNSVKGQMYGIPHGYGANVLMYRTDKIKPKPTSWNVVWDKNSPAKDHIVDYDSPTYIADAALYLKAHRKDLKITDPYELDQKQFDAAVSLLKGQRSNVNQYWANYLDELQAFKSGDNWAGTAWQVTANQAKTEKAPVDTMIPSEGATGWSDTWMVGSKAAHPNCMYKWMNWITEPKVQAQVAQYFGEAPANPKACQYAGKAFCAEYNVGDKSFYNRVAFWKTPIANCGDDRGNTCVDYSKWTQAWTQIKG